MQWYWREFNSVYLFGPANFYLAREQARELSKQNESGLAEVVVFDGPQMFSVLTFLRGKLRYQGKRARDASKYNLPPRS